MKNDDIHIRDPFVLPIVTEKQYYLYGTTGADAWSNSAQGIDYFRSANLQDWKGPFPAFRPAKGFWADCNFWVPEVHIFRERCYMFASFKAEGVCRGRRS